MTSMTVQVAINSVDQIIPVLPDDRGRGFVTINHDIFLFAQNPDQCARIADAFTGLGNSWLDRDKAVQS